MIAPNQAQPDDISIVVATLQRRNLFRAGMTDTNVLEAYREMRAADDADRMQSQAMQRTENLERVRIESMRRSLSNRGIDHAGMTVATMQAKIAEDDAADKAERERKAAADKIERDKREQERRELHSAREMSRLFKAAECPPLHTEKLSVMDSKNPKLSAMRKLLAEQIMFANGFIVALLGLRGTGKTQLAVSVIHSATQKLLSARYVRAMDLFRDLRSAFDPKSKREFVASADSEESHVDKFANCELLVIDELHNRGGSDYELNALTNLLDRRYAARLCTILIANQSAAEFAAGIGDSIVSRIHECGECFVCDWPSYRKPGTWKTAAAEPRKPMWLNQGWQRGGFDLA